MLPKELHSHTFAEISVLTELLVQPKNSFYGISSFFRKLMNGLNQTFKKSFAGTKNLKANEGKYLFSTSIRQNVPDSMQDAQPDNGDPQVTKNILKALGDLPKEHYDMLIDYASGLKYYEIAACYGMSKAKVKSQILVIQKDLKRKCMFKEKYN